MTILKEWDYLFLQEVDEKYHGKLVVGFTDERHPYEFPRCVVAVHDCEEGDLMGSEELDNYASSLTPPKGYEQNIFYYGANKYRKEEAYNVVYSDFR